jgi:hypothetical protein
MQAGCLKAGARARLAVAGCTATATAGAYAEEAGTRWVTGQGKETRLQPIEARGPHLCASAWAALLPVQRWSLHRFTRKPQALVALRAGH